LVIFFYFYAEKSYKKHEKEKMPEKRKTNRFLSEQTRKRKDAVRLSAATNNGRGERVSFKSCQEVSADKKSKAQPRKSCLVTKDNYFQKPRTMVSEKVKKSRRIVNSKP